jgi:hypothetical protein
VLLDDEFHLVGTNIHSDEVKGINYGEYYIPVPYNVPNN